MNCQCFAAARLTWPAYDDGRKLENNYVWTDRIIIASTCRRSVQFVCYITWLWMANCGSVTIKMLTLFNFTISCHGRRAWKTSRCACALAGSHFWLIETTLFGDHVSVHNSAYRPIRMYTLMARQTVNKNLHNSPYRPIRSYTLMAWQTVNKNPA